jgi:hypothetical protein
MSVLGAVAIDFAEQLKKQSKGWTITPLVIHEETIKAAIAKGVSGGIGHNDFLFVKRTPPNQSPYSFYAANPPLNQLTFLQIKQPKKPLRLLGLRLESTVNYTINLSFWRANGYVQHDDSPRKRCFRRYQQYGGGVEGYDSLLMCAIHHVGPKQNKARRPLYKHSFDLTVPEPPTDMAALVVRIIDKSYEWWGRGKEVFGHYQFPLMVDLDGKNYNADEHHVW